MKTNKLLIFLLLIFFINSIEKLCASAIKDSLQITQLFDSASIYCEAAKYSKAIEFIIEAKAKNKNIKSKYFEGQGLFISGIVEQKMGDFRHSINYFKNALSVFIKIKKQMNVASTNGAIGLSLCELNNYPEALSYYFNALKIYESLKNEKLIANTLANISIVFWSQEKYDSAIEYLKKSTKILKRINDKESIAYNYGNEALYYSTNKQNDKAIEKYLETIELCTELNDRYCLANAFSNLGLLISEKGDLKTALNYQQKAIAYRKEISDRDGLASSYCNLAQIYLGNKNLDSALFYAKFGLKLCKESESQEAREEGFLLLSKVYEQKGDFSNAYLNFKNYTNVHDSLFNAINTEKITRAEMSYEYDKKEQIKRNKELLIENELAQNKIQKYLILTLLIASIIILFFIIRDYLNKTKLNLELNKKNNLLMQLNREKDALTKIVAHDLKTPIGQVKGLAQLIDMLGTLNPQQKEILDKMNISVEIGNKLIENLMNVNKLEDPEMPTVLETVNVESVIHKAIENQKSSAIIKNITTILNITFLGNILSNEEYLFEILDNLISNAIKFSEHGKQVYVDCFEDDLNVYISVKDEAQGFNEKDLENIFLKYQKLSASPTGGEKSTGLGLYIVKLLADKIDAQILLDSTVNVGSSFTVVFKKKQVNA